MFHGEVKLTDNCIAETKGHDPALAESDEAQEHLKHAEEEFKKLAAMNDKEFLKAEQFAEEAIKKAKTTEARQEFQDALEHLKVVDKEHTD